MQLYTKSQFASLVCRDERTIERWIAKGKIVPGRLPSGAPVFSQAHLDAIMAGGHAATRQTRIEAAKAADATPDDWFEHQQLRRSLRKRKRN